MKKEKIQFTDEQEIKQVGIFLPARAGAPVFSQEVKR